MFHGRFLKYQYGENGGQGENMIKKVWFLGISLVFLLTGCGMPDAVADELMEVSRETGFADGKESAERFIKAYDKAEEDCTEKVKQSEIMAKRLDALAAFLEKKVAEGTASIGDYHADEEGLDDDRWYEGVMDEEDGQSHTDLMSDLERLKNWRNDAGNTKVFSGTPDVLAANFYIEIDKMPGFLQELGEIGFQGLSLPTKEYHLQADQISQGVGFCIAHVSGYYHVSVWVVSDHFAYPEKYTDLLENHMRDAFMTESIICGGDLDYISFEGSTDEPLNNYFKTVELYLKDGKVLQMNLKSALNSSETGGELFTEQEKKDLSELLAWMTGDEKGAQSFIEGLAGNNDTEGDLGNYKWYRSKDKTSGMELIRIQ